MKRIDIEYAGNTYRVGNRDLSDLQSEISEGMQSGSHWLTVDDGEGQNATAFLHLSPGTAIALLPIAEEQPEAGVQAPAGGRI